MGESLVKAEQRPVGVCQLYSWLSLMVAGTCPCEAFSKPSATDPESLREVWLEE